MNNNNEFYFIVVDENKIPLYTKNADSLSGIINNLVDYIKKQKSPNEFIINTHTGNYIKYQNIDKNFKKLFEKINNRWVLNKNWKSKQSFYIIEQ